MPKRRKKKKKSIKRKAVLCIMSALLLLLLCIAAYFVNNYIERTSYRMPYKAEILEFSKKYELEPALVAAVVHCESGNQSDSVSIKGAIGLMQIMPETGEWIAHKLNIEEYSAEMLYDPRVNVEMGCWYLNFLKQRFNNNFTNFIAAYNAGHGKVEEWLENSEYALDGQLVDIPYKETREYVKRVKSAMEKYEELYEQALYE